MITIVSSKGKCDFPPGCVLEKTSVTNFISYFMGLDPAFFVLSFKDQEGDVIALDTNQDYEALKHLRGSGMEHIEISIDWIPDQTDAGESYKQAIVEATKQTSEVQVVEAAKPEEKKTQEPKPKEESAQKPAETKEGKEKEVKEKESKEAKAEKQKQKQLEKQKAQQQLKKAREEKQLQAKLEKERKVKEKEEQQRLKKEAQAKAKQAKQLKEGKKEAPKEEQSEEVKKPEQEKKHKSVEKDSPVKAVSKEVKPNAFIRSTTAKQLTICTVCEQSPLAVPYYRCVECQRYSICQKCESKNNHEHPLLKIKNADDVPLLVVTVTATQVEAKENEEEFVNELKNVATQKLNALHKNKVKSLRDEKASLAKLEKEREKEEARLQKEKEKAQQKEKERQKAEAKQEQKKKREGKEGKKKEQPAELEKAKQVGTGSG